MPTGGSKLLSVSGSIARPNRQCGHPLRRYESVRLCTSLPRVQSVACLRHVCPQREVEKDRNKSSRRRYRCKLGSLLPLRKVNRKGGRGPL